MSASLVSPAPPSRGTVRSASTNRGAAGATSEVALLLTETPSGAVAMAPSAQCDLGSCPFVRLLMDEFERGNDAAVRDGIAKALALPGDVNEDEALVADSVDLGSSAIVDAYTGVLSFAALNSFSAPQTQQLLLLLADALELLVTHAPEPGVARASPAAAGSPTSDSPVQQQQFSSHRRQSAAAGAAMGGNSQPHPLNDVLVHFTRKVARMCAATEMLVDERSVELVERTEERVDPAAVAAYEAKLAKAKKGQTVEPPVPTLVRVKEEQEVFTRKTIVVGPYFNPADMALVVEYFNSTVFQHWVLYREALLVPRRVDVTRRAVFIDDVPSFLAPLRDAVPLADHTMAEQRLDAEREADDAGTALLAEEAAEWDALAAEATAGAAAVAARDAAEKQADHDAAMSATEYEHTKRVLDGAVSAAVHKKVTAASIAKRIERLEAAANTGQLQQAATLAAAGASPGGASSPAAPASPNMKGSMRK